MVITGESFTGATRVTFASLTAATFTVDSYIQITITAYYMLHGYLIHMWRRGRDLRLLSC
jgi:hypothetical protein